MVGVPLTVTTPREVVLVIWIPRGAIGGEMKLFDETLNRDPGTEHGNTPVETFEKSDVILPDTDDGGVNVNGSPRESPWFRTIRDETVKVTGSTRRSMNELDPRESVSKNRVPAVVTGGSAVVKKTLAEVEAPNKVPKVGSCVRSLRFTK
jgi:hypothetical protein